MAKKVLIALNPSMMEALDQVAEVENRTRSDLVRECIRRYINEFKRQHGIKTIVRGSTLTEVEISTALVRGADTTSDEVKFAASPKPKPFAPIPHPPEVIVTVAAVRKSAPQAPPIPFEDKDGRTWYTNAEPDEEYDDCILPVQNEQAMA